MIVLLYCGMRRNKRIRNFVDRHMLSQSLFAFSGTKHRSCFWGWVALSRIGEWQDVFLSNASSTTKPISVLLMLNVQSDAGVSLHLELRFCEYTLRSCNPIFIQINTKNEDFGRYGCFCADEVTCVLWPEDLLCPAFSYCWNSVSVLQP